MKKLKIKNIAVVSAFVIGNLIAVAANSSVLYSGDYTQTTVITASLSTLPGNSSAIGSFTTQLPGTTFYIRYTATSGSGAFFLTNSSARLIGTITLDPSGNGVGTTVSPSNGAPATHSASNFYVASGSTSFPFTISNLCISNVSLSECASGGGSGSGSIDLVPNAYALRSVYNIQSAALNAGLSYDCNMFDKQGFCLSTGGRYSTTNSPETNTTSGLLIGSYKYDKHIRLGAWVDQNLSTNNTTGMTLSNSNPLFGVFGAWAERNDGLGYEVKVSAGYGDKDVTVTRTSTNQGSTQLRMRGISAVSSFGFAIDGGLIAAPYVGVKYTSINRGAYTEGGSSALTYDNLRQESTTAVAGVRLSGKIDNQTGFVVSAGAEHDLNHNVGQYSAGSSNTTAFNSNVQKTRPVVTAGVFYDIDKTQRIGVNAIHRQEPFQSTTSTTGLVTYTVGF